MHVCPGGVLCEALERPSPVAWIEGDHAASPPAVTRAGASRARTTSEKSAADGDEGDGDEREQEPLGSHPSQAR
jgi:hypothetical protein